MNDFVLEKLYALVGDAKCALNYRTDYELLIACMLSARTTDKGVNKVTEVLFKYSLDEIIKMDTEKLENIIRPTGTYRRKAVYVKEITKEIKKIGYVPHDREFVESLPGVGHKVCNVVFSEIYKDDVIAVDTHVERVSKRLGLADKNDNVREVENKLMDFFKPGTRSKAHLQLVAFGRNYCTARNPKCKECPFLDICKEEHK